MTDPPDILHHDDQRPPEAAVGDQALIDAVSAHVDAHIGPPENVLHEVLSTYVHVDLHVVAPREERPVRTVVTSGMAERAMHFSDGSPTYSELVLALPPDWPTPETPAFDDARHGWPFRMLRDLARLPHEFGFAVDVGHTLPNGDPAEPYGPNTEFCCALFGPPLLVDDQFDVLQHDGTEIRFLSVVPIYEDEMLLKLRDPDRFYQCAVRAELDELLDPERPSIVPRRRGLFRKS